ncbi:uncharacterized protein LOC132201344 [Neocloeon triangulifer]|uniref:uncharacterized protein LOC132201344 n=1 Tax=Neocloeon triangulifer TaxID=2078957 RepID=UPI00286F406C|nr:uncharacterized protein LOC132201344 [Neocloeon triangulifer]
MTDYTEVRMRTSVVVLTALIALAAANTAQQPAEDKTLSAAALTIARALQQEVKLPQVLTVAENGAETQEYRLQGATLVVKRRSKTPQLFQQQEWIPNPVMVTSETVKVIPADAGTKASSRSGRQMMTVDSDGIPVITGVRVPDDEHDRTHTYRNARVIKNVLVPNDAPAPSSRTQHTRQARKTGELEAIRPTVLDQGPTAVRAPILQYAHPELGAQPVMHLARELDVAQKPTYEQPPVYFSQDNPQEIHNDHSPYPYEPAEALHHQRPYEATASPAKSYDLPKPRPPKKTLPYQFNDDGLDVYKYRYKNKGYKYLPEQTGSPSSLNTYATYYSPLDDSSRPFWMRFTELIRDNVQTGYSRMAELARPVMEPIVAATQNIGANFGIATGSTRAQEKLGVVAPLLTGGHVAFAPAIGLVAGGAALGLGAAAISRMLETTQVVHGKSRTRRSLLTGGGPLIAFQDRNSNEEDVMFGNMVHDLQGGQPDSFLAQLSKYGHSSWSEDTPCAKRIFCDVMTQQSQDSVILMEKKMATFLTMVNPSVARALSNHMGDVMDAVRRQDCSQFTCQAESRRRRMGVGVSQFAFQPRAAVAGPR